MKTIGLLGGMSWESTIEYYRIINEETKRLMGSSHSAKCLIYSFDFNEIETWQHKGEWDKIARKMILWGGKLKAAGADFLVICSNMIHFAAADIEAETGLKVINIAEVTGKKVQEKGIEKVVLLGTKYTMEGTFYKDVLKNTFR